MITKTFAALTAITVALALAVVPALTNQALAFPGENGQGHTQECDKKNTDVVEEGPCPGQSQKSPNKCEVTFAGKSEHIKDVEDEDPACATT